MKRTAAVVLLACLALLSPTVAQEDRTITKVVKLLQGMLEKSKADGDADRVIFAKLKCYCDAKTETKNREIDDLAKQISVIQSNIQDLLGLNGELSIEVAGLKKAIAENQQAQNEAMAIREKEHTNFVATEADLTKAIADLENALNVLTEVGSDQTLAAAADHTKFLAGFKSATLLKLRSTVTQAMAAASAFIGGPKRRAVESFLQAPFTGSYTAQSGEVVGILKNMRDTFKSNLDAAVTAEAAQKAAFNNLMATKAAEKAQMEQLHNEKQDQLGANDGALAAKRKQLDDSETQKAVRQEFLSQLIPTCEQKTAEYKDRTVLRANEDAAISEAISILNSDAAFATFGTTAAATSGAAFLQRAAIRVHSPSVHDVDQEALGILRKAAAPSKSLRLTKIVALLAADTPFTVVLQEITKVVSLLDEEGTVDKNKLDWCNAERVASDKTVEDKTAQIVDLLAEITALTSDIEAPETGLKAQISATVSALEENTDDQKSATGQRAAENAEFQQNVRDLASAEELLASAISVLKKYYGQIPGLVKEESSPTAFAGEEAARPDTWEAEGGYKGQSSAGDKALGMLEFILSETQKEEATARTDEANSLASFEATMADLRSGESSLQGSMATLKKTLAEKEGDLLERQASHRNTDAEKTAVEAYLADIKPGCDFITSNFDTRETRRATERTALLSVEGLLRGTPAFKSAVTEAHAESLGPCKDPCLEAPEAVECKACLNKVTIPAYCAGHLGTPGC